MPSAFRFALGYFCLFCFEKLLSEVHRNKIRIGVWLECEVDYNRVACGILLCVASAERWGKFRHTGRFDRLRCGYSSVPFICRFGAETARTRRGLWGVLAWGGRIPYLVFSCSKIPQSFAVYGRKRRIFFTRLQSLFFVYAYQILRLVKVYIFISFLL